MADLSQNGQAGATIDEVSGRDCVTELSDEALEAGVRAVSEWRSLGGFEYLGSVELVLRVVACHIDESRNTSIMDHWVIMRPIRVRYSLLTNSSKMAALKWRGLGFMGSASKDAEQRREDEILRRMLNTPPKPHPKRERDQSVTPKGKKAKKTPAK